MVYGRRSTATSILEVLSLNPLPYPVLIILAVTFIFLGMSWYLSIEDTVETAGQKISWILLIIPIMLLILVLWLSSMNPSWILLVVPIMLLLLALWLSSINPSWMLLVFPTVLLLLALWLSSMNPDSFFAMNPWDERPRTHHIPYEGSSPWGVAAVIVLLLVLLQYQSIFRDSWLIK